MMDEEIDKIKEGYSKVLYKYIYNNYLIAPNDKSNRLRDFKIEFKEEMKKYPLIFLQAIDMVEERLLEYGETEDGIPSKENDEIFEFLEELEEDMNINDEEFDTLEEDYTNILCKYLYNECLFGADTYLNIIYHFKKDFKEEMKSHPGIFLRVISRVKETEYIKGFAEYDEYDLDYDHPIILLDELEEKISSYTIVYPNRE